MRVCVSPPPGYKEQFKHFTLKSVITKAQEYEVNLKLKIKSVCVAMCSLVI